MHIISPQLELSNSKELFEECQQFCDDSLLLFSSAAATEPGHGRHQFINIRTGGLDRTITEGNLDKLTGLLFFQVLFL